MENGMTKEQYDHEMSLINDKYKAMKNDLYVRYAESNNTIKKGSIVSTGNSSIIVDKINISLMFSRYPQIMYYGRILTKKGVPRKDGECMSISKAKLDQLTPNKAE